jgi:hypothetical protein
LNVITATVVAYNDKMGQDVQAEITELPEDLSQITVKLGQVKFPDGATWEFELANDYPISATSAPEFRISLHRPERQRTGVSGMLRVFFITSREGFRYDGYFYASSGSLPLDKATHEVNEFDDIIKNTVLSIFEKQVIVLQQKSPH